MIKTIIRAVPERFHYQQYLMERLPSAEWSFDQHHNDPQYNGQQKSTINFLAALRMSGDEPTLHMEEDVLLCDGFSWKIIEAIARHPDNIIQFFSMRNDDLTIGSRWDNNFMMNQCFYLPAGYAKMLWEYYRIWPQREKHPGGYDIMMGDWLRSRKEKYWIEIPNLVDHRVGKSIADSRRSSKRVSKTFHLNK